jgi:hypothetical protein
VWAGCGAHLGPGVEEVEVNESQLQGVYVLWVQVGVGGGNPLLKHVCGSCQWGWERREWVWG